MQVIKSSLKKTRKSIFIWRLIGRYTNKMSSMEQNALQSGETCFAGDIAIREHLCKQMDSDPGTFDLVHFNYN